MGSAKGTALSLKMMCLNGHAFRWMSQPLLGEGSDAVPPAGNILVPAAILFSGNNFGKMSHFADILNWQFISNSMHDNYQAAFLFPTIHDASEKEKQRVHAWHNTREKGQLRICGDGRCDSPGHNAKYGT